MSGNEVKACLAEQKVTVWVSLVSFWGEDTEIDFEARASSEVVRASVQYYNSEITALVNAIRELTAQAEHTRSYVS